MIEQKCPILAYFCCLTETAAKFMKKIPYALVARANFQKNSGGRINNKKRNHALSVGHFKHITKKTVSRVKHSNILIIKFTNIQVLRMLVL